MNNKPVFAIDPGDKFSAYAIYFPDTHAVYKADKVSNQTMRKILIESVELYNCEYAIEMIASYGMPVGANVFNTCVWIGQFKEVLRARKKAAYFIYRKDVKMHLCGATKGVNDAVIRRRIMDMFPQTGGGKKPVIGTKTQPGPLYGMANDMWAALAVALTYAGVDK